MGLGANFYEPIARAIDGINNQLNLNAKRADDREARGMQQLLTASQLQTQQETNELNRRTAERQDQRLSMAISAHSDAKAQSIINENRTKVLHAQAIKNFDVDNMRSENERQQLKIQNTPAAVNIYEQMGGFNQRTQNLLSDPKNIALIESIHGNNTRFDPVTGFLYSKSTGKKILISPIKYNNVFSPKLFNLPYLITDPQAVLRGDSNELNSKLVGLTNQLKEYSPSSNKGVDINIANKTRIKHEIRQVEAQMIKTANVPTSELIDRYVQRGDRLLKFGIANQYNPQLIRAVESAQAQNEAMLSRLYRSQAAGIKSSAKISKGVGKWKDVDNHLSKFYFTKDANGQWFLKPEQRKRYGLAFSIARQLRDKGMDDFTAAETARKKVDEEEQKYFDTYEQMMARYAGDHKKAMRGLKNDKQKGLGGKTVNQFIMKRLKYIPSLKEHIKNRELLPK